MEWLCGSLAGWQLSAVKADLSSEQTPLGSRLPGPSLLLPAPEWWWVLALPRLGCTRLPRSPPARHPLATPWHLRMKNKEGRLGGRLLPVGRSRAVFTSFFSFSFLLPSWLSMKWPKVAGGWAVWLPPSCPPSLGIPAPS